MNNRKKNDHVKTKKKTQDCIQVEIGSWFAVFNQDLSQYQACRKSKKHARKLKKKNTRKKLMKIAHEKNVGKAIKKKKM